jgi:hypothetical protein
MPEQNNGPVVFPISPQTWQTKDCLRAFVYPTQVAMMKGARARGFRFETDFHAGCLTFPVRRISLGGFTRCWGDVFFSRQRLSAGLVAHEITHAAISLAESARWNIGTFAGGTAASLHEENFCEAIESLVDQFFDGCAWHGITTTSTVRLHRQLAVA